LLGAGLRVGLRRPRRDASLAAGPARSRTCCGRSLTDCRLRASTEA